VKEHCIEKLKNIVLNNRSKKYLVVVLVLSLCLISACKVRYSMTGASLTTEKTISVQYFQNRADIVNPTLSQEFTEALKDKFISQTSLEMVTDGGDLNFEGEIVGYSTDPAAITGDETAALNRFTIRIKVNFINEVDPSKSFEYTFRHYADYDSQNSLDAVEGELVPEILENIIEDIFNKAVVNW